MISPRFISIFSFLITLMLIGTGCRPTNPKTETPPVQLPESFSWPEGINAAFSLTFDDARFSQVDTGLAVLGKYDAKATFYVSTFSLEERLEGWKKAVAEGHEIGNHSLTHPCTGNFDWSREKALENFDLEKMKHEFTESNRIIQELLGVTPTSFAYPCGQKFVGRGAQTKSYIPLVAEMFQSGRGWQDEATNEPYFCDLAQLTGVSYDAQDFEEILPVLEKAKANGQWLVLAGHEIGTEGAQTTRIEMLEKLIAYAQNPENGIWLATVDEITKYVADQRVVKL